MKYRLVIWDFDGTLADSLQAGLVLFNRLAGELRYRPITDPEAVRQMTARQFLRHHGIPWWRLPRLAKHFHAAAAELDIRLHPDVLQMVQLLAQKRVRQGILSSNSVENIRKTLVDHRAEELFEFVESCGGLFGKPRALRRIVRRSGVPRDQILYIGDEERDVRAARSAGVAAAAVAWGFHVPAVLKAARPNHFVERAEEILHLLAPSQPAVPAMV